MRHMPLTLADAEALRTTHQGQLQIAARVLGGQSLQTVANDTGVGLKTISRIVHVVCQYRNPDVYCDELKACLKRSIYAWDVKPSLTFLRQHAADFGFYVPSSEVQR